MKFNGNITNHLQRLQSGSKEKEKKRLVKDDRDKEKRGVLYCNESLL